MRTAIIGIHGLRNKPPRYVLTSWWRQSVAEGLAALKLPSPRIRLELAYWAHIMHPRSQNPAIADRDDPRYLAEPYVPGALFGPREREAFRREIRAAIGHEIARIIAGRGGFCNIGAVSNAIVHRMFVELDAYYHHDIRAGSGPPRPARECMREPLVRLLVKNRHKRIMLLAHSMGSIIAYDVLMHVVPDIPVHTFITFGSPLGFPVITNTIRRELGVAPDAPLPAPPSITHKWLNLSDLDDVTCLQYNLRNEYRENAAGVRPFDEVVYNNYECRGGKNPHKAYGYLRTAEMARAIYHFCALENAGLWQRIKWVFARPVFG
jgi:hypothetical protein